MRSVIIFMLLVLPSICFAQFGISFHQSNLPFVGLNYEMKNRLRPELRLGTDNYFEAMSVEGVLTYDLVNKEDYQFYAGLGGKSEWIYRISYSAWREYLSIATKQFGFHIELSPLIAEPSLLRGSWGIRYRFKKTN